MTPARAPVQRARDGKLLVVDEDGAVTHRLRTDFPSLVREDDVVVANDAATLPASLSGIHLPTGHVVEVRLAGRHSLSPSSVRSFTAVVFGAGDFRTPAERRPPPPDLRAGDVLQLGPLAAVIVRRLAHPRLVEISFQNSIDAIWEGLARHGRPIQYAYLPEPLAVWDTWTRIASQPVAFEPPSAGFILDWQMVQALRRSGARFVSITHSAGISSTGDADLDRWLPFDEPYVIPSLTATIVEETKDRGGRVIAIGTTVVRALEDSVQTNGAIRAGDGIATQRIGRHTELRLVDAIVSGVHETGSSHYELLRAFQSDDTLSQMQTEAENHDYKTHEFGDWVFLLRGRYSKSMSVRQSMGCSAHA